MSKTALGIRKLLSTVATLVLFSVTGAHAESPQIGIPGLYDAERLEWKHVDEYMSTRQYREASRHNRKLFREAARRALVNTLTSYGIPRQGVEITGAAVGLAVKGVKLNLNDSKTLTMEVKDVVNEGRGISLNLNLDW